MDFRFRGNDGSLFASLVAATLALAGCSPPGEPVDPVASALEELRAFERDARARTDFAHLPPSDWLGGPNPVRVACLGGGRAVGLLRGDWRVALLRSGDLGEIRRAWAMSPTALAVAGERIFVGGPHGAICENTADLRERRVTETGLSDVRDIAVDRGTIYAVSEIDGALAIADADRDGPVRIVSGFEQPIRVAVEPPWLIVDELAGHALAIVRGDDPITRIVHDGPIWSFASFRAGSELGLVALGVEDRPLDRRGGFFGNIDSFAFLYRVSGGRARRLAELNLSAAGVINPKAAVWLDRERLLVAGYGGERAAVLRVGDSLAIERIVDAPPGIADMARCDGSVIAADPLLDAWIPLGREPVPAAGSFPPPKSSAAVRLGEALVFTSLMAPFNSSEGAHSRFSCETCHFEGGGDGRAHHTGRGEVHATTKPLFGLFNNAPHFTRALDPDLTKVANAEFRVAGAGSGHDPWYALDTAEHPWLATMTGVSGEFQPHELRRGLMEFLMQFTHPSNPNGAARRQYDVRERAGAAAFRARCAGCHAARLVTDDAASEVPFDGWANLIFSAPGPIVWASDGYRKTGVEPYVHADGARTSSLRRIAWKHPYFTNGSARTLEEVLARARVGASFWHDRAPADAAPLSLDEQRALRAFLELL